MRKQPLLFLGAVAFVVSACSASMASTVSERPAVPHDSVQGTPVPEANLGAETNDLPTTPQIIGAVAGSVGTIKWPNLPDPGKWDGKCIGTKGPPSCWNGDPTGNGTILILGDSYAAMWAPAIMIRARETARKVELMSLGACPWPDFPAWSVRLKRRHTECDAFRVTAVEHVREIRPEVVIVASAYQGVLMERDGKPTQDGLEDAWIAGVITMIGRLKDAGAGRIVVMGDVAVSKSDPLDCLTSHPDNVPACNTSRASAVVAAHNLAERHAAETNGATYVDTVPWLCTDEVCPEVIAGVTVRKDRWHLSTNYTLWLRRALIESMGL